MEFPERVVSYVMVAAKPEAKMQMVLIQYSVLKTVILHKRMVHAVQHDYILQPISTIIA